MTVLDTGPTTSGFSDVVVESSALQDAGVWIVIPCYRVRRHILHVLEAVPSWVEGVVCVDDACPEGSGDYIEANTADPRVIVIRLEENRGVGGATMAGYAEADRRGGRILVKVDGDDQMNLDYLPWLVAPIYFRQADYTKGSRFSSALHLRSMPAVRVFGNAALSLAAKASTGYWNVFDPTNGFTAIEASVAREVIRKKVARRYFFETDLLYHLCTLRAVVRDVPIPARYADEISNLRIARILLPFAGKHMHNLLRRIVGQYYVRDFSIASIELLLGACLLVFGGLYSLHWMVVREVGQAASAGMVMTAALPIIIGVQFLLQALNFDVANVPSRPIHPYLRAVERMGHQKAGDDVP